MNNTIYLLNTGSQLFSNITKLFNTYNLKYTVINDSEKDLGSNIIYVPLDNITSIRNFKTNNIYFFLTKIYDNMLIGPLSYPEDRKCPQCLLETMKQYQKENFLTIFSEKISEVEFNKKELNFLHRFFTQNNFLNRYKKYIDLVNFKNINTSSYLSIQNEFCTYCQSISLDAPSTQQIKFSGVRKKNDKTYRTKENFDISKLDNSYSDNKSGLFIHKFDDIRSTYIIAKGVEVEVNPNFTVAGYGRALSPQEAYKVGVLEAIERYCGMVNRRTRTHIYGSYNQLRYIKAIDPRTLGLPNSKGNDYVSYSDDLKYHWVWGTSLKSNESVLLPEQLVYYVDSDLVNQSRVQKTNRFMYETSNGLALGNTPEEAIFHGLLELIERDNFLCVWYNQKKVQELDVEGYDLELNYVLDFIKSRGVEIHFYDISLELELPCIWALAINTSTGSKMKCYSAAGCHPNPVQALKSSAMEVITSLPIFEELISEYPTYNSRVKEVGKGRKNVKNQDDHILYYASEENFSAFDFVLKNNNKKKMNEVFDEDKIYLRNTFLKDDVIELVNRICDYYKDVYVVNVTPKKIEEQGLFAYKCIVPGMLPMYFGEQNQRLIVDRIEKERIRSNLGFENFTINKNPHPFP